MVGTNQDEMPGSGGDGLPDILRGAGHLDFGLDGAASRGILLHWHDGSSLHVTLRLVRQRVCHEYQAMRATSRGRFIVVARDKGRHGVDELVTEGGAIGRRRNRISVSSDSVARRLSAARDRRRRSLTSSTMRAARAMR